MDEKKADRYPFHFSLEKHFDKSKERNTEGLCRDELKGSADPGGGAKDRIEIGNECPGYTSSC